MKVLISGSSGFVGQHLVDEIKKTTHQFIDLPIEIDICEADSVESFIHEHSPDVIFHLAAISAIPECEKNFKKALEVNVLGTENILNSARKLSSPPKIIFISSANVYGIVSDEELPLNETSLVKPNNNYAITKVMAEELVKKYERDTKTSCVIFRAFNHVGPGQTENFVIPSFIKQVADIKKGTQSPKMRVGNLTAKKDFSDVRDIVKAYVKAIDSGSGVYNLGSGNIYSVEEILAKIISYGGEEVQVEIDPERYRENELPVLSTSTKKANQDLDWQAKISIDQSIADIFASMSS